MGIQKGNMQFLTIFVFIKVIVNALSLADIDKLENSILELEKNHIAKTNDHDADHMIGIHDDDHHLGEWDDEGKKAELIQEANAELIKLCLLLDNKSDCLQTVFNTDYIWK